MPLIHVLWYLDECLLCSGYVDAVVVVDDTPAMAAKILRGIPLWVSDSSRGYEGHQKVHAAEAVEEDVVTEAPADDTEPVAPAPTLPMQAKVKNTAKVIPTQGTAAGKGTPSSSKKQAKGKEKEWDKPPESHDDDADEEE